MGNNRFNPLVSSVGRRLCTGQHGAGVENIEAFVLHGAHVEVVHRNDHEDVQIVFTTIGFFVPAHGLFQAVHGVLAFVDVLGLDVNAQRHGAISHGGERVFNAPQVARDQGKQVGRLFKRVFPGRPVAAVFIGAAGQRVTVGQQDRVAMLFGDHGSGERAHHVRAVKVIGDLAKAFGLALGAEHRAGLVQAFQRGIGFGVDLDAGVDHKLLGGRMQGQVAVCQLVVRCGQLDIVKLDRQQLQLLAVQRQGREALATGGIAAHHQLRMDQRVVLEQLEGQVRLVNQVLGRLVVLQVDHLRLFGAHAAILFTDARPTGRPCICEY